jgi:hypothetical protein
MSTAVPKIREESTSGTEGRGEIEFLVFDADDLAAAKAAVLAVAPTTYDDLPLHSVNCVRAAEETHLGTIWDATVYYGRWSGSTPQEGSIYTFEIRGGTQHITHSLETVWRGGADDSSAPDHKGAIGVRGDEIEGVDIVVPISSWSETHYKAVSQVTPAYHAILNGLVGRTNNSDWREYAQGEVLFMGVTGRRPQIPGAKWELTYHFAYSQNAEDLVVGDIVIPEKRGWDYLWVSYGGDVDSDSVPGKPSLVQRPRYAYIERTYREGNFTALGID